MIALEQDQPSPPFTFRAVQVFVTVAETQSVTRAAHKLAVSPSTVSQQLAALEGAMGARLVERSSRHFRLTPAGLLFLPTARHILDCVTTAKAQLVLADQQPPLSLRFAAIEELDSRVTAPWLLRLQSLFPNINVSLTSGASHENQDALNERAVDMMLAVDTVSTADWVEQHPVLRDPFILVTRRGSAPVTNLKDVTTRPFVRYAPDLQIGRQIETQLRRVASQPPAGFQFSTNQALFSMTGEIDGWAITSALAYLGTPHADDMLQPHPLPMPKFSRQLSMHTRKGILGTLPVQIADALRDVLDAQITPLARQNLPFVGDGFRVIRNAENIDSV